ncbi:TrkA Predicted flavoprotein involved in K+ transport [Acidimicrobiia bacterium]
MIDAINPHAGLPFDDDDDAIRAALEDVSIPTLLLSCVHMSGNLAVIRGALKPHGLVINEVQGFMSPDEQTASRDVAFEIIRNFRDGGCILPPAPSTADIKEMMDWLCCEEVPAEYLPMLDEELVLDGVDKRRVAMKSSPTDRADFPVLVIGAGESGVLAGIRLQESGIPFTVIEKNAGVGGTWFENSYPGARVDVGNHFYCYSFEPSDHWTEYYAQQPELRKYFDDVVVRHRIESNIRFGTEVTGAVWNNDAGTWTVSLRTVDGSTDQLEVRAIISAVGQLNRPNVPNIDGLDTFTGDWFHSAQWNHDVDYIGKRVALVGAGASGFQIAPTIAPDVAELKVFQRTAQWMFPNPNYRKSVGPGFRWALKHLPFYGRWYRFLILWSACDKGLMGAKVDPEWPNQERSVSEGNEFTRLIFTDWITSQVGDDPELLAKVIPDYPPTAKRTLQDDGSWLGALSRNNVELIRDSIDRIDGNAIVLADGTRHEVDIIVFATGFLANRFLWPMDIIGRSGVSLRDTWGERPKAYLGITIPDFPNLFCMYGPGTNLAHGGSLIFHSECQMRYITGCIDALIDGDLKAMEPSQLVHDEYYERVQAELKTLVWSSPQVRHSWFKNADGDIHVLSPWRLVDYWGWTQEPNLRDFILN